MLTMVRRESLKLIGILCATMVAIGMPVAQAQTVPFHITGAGAGPTGLPLPGQPPRTHWSVGTATSLGPYFSQGKLINLSFNPATFRGTFGSSGGHTFTAANGDKLVTNYGSATVGDGKIGNYKLTVVGVTTSGVYVTARFVAEFVVDPTKSTGKFAGANGSWLMTAQSTPWLLGSNDPLGYYWYGDGELKLKK